MEPGNSMADSIADSTADPGQAPRLWRSSADRRGADHFVQVLNRPLLGVMVIAISQHTRRRPVEAANEPACGNKDLTRDVTRQVAGEVGVEGRHKFGRGAIQ